MYMRNAGAIWMLPMLGNLSLAFYWYNFFLESTTGLIRGLTRLLGITTGVGLLCFLSIFWCFLNFLEWVGG